MAGTGQTKRKDKNRIVLKKGEGQRSNGSYYYRWEDEFGKRHTVYAKSLKELREKEASIQRSIIEGIRFGGDNLTTNDLYEMWFKLKRGVRDTTLNHYSSIYKNYVQNSSLGSMRITSVKRSTIKSFFILQQEELHLSLGTIDNIYIVLVQVFGMAVEDGYIMKNPVSNTMKEISKSSNTGRIKRSALTREEQAVFLECLQRSTAYSRYYPLYAVMLGTGMRVGEAAGLQWEDVDMDALVISVRHNLVAIPGPDGTCLYEIHEPKSKAGIRKIPITDFVKAALEKEREYQQALSIHSTRSVSGYSNFVFLNKKGNFHIPSNLSSILYRIKNNHNKKVLGGDPAEPKTLLPNFSCHTLRHTFATRMCESGVNIKVVQDIMGHEDISTTLNIYTDASQTFKAEELSKANLSIR